MARLRAVAVAAVTAWCATSCASVGDLYDRMAGKCGERAGFATVNALVQRSPLPATHIDRPVRTSDRALERALRFNGIPIEQGRASLRVTLDCSTMGKRRKNRRVLVTLSAPGAWRVSTTVMPGRPHGMITAVNLDGGRPVFADPGTMVALVGNRGARRRPIPAGGAAPPDMAGRDGDGETGAVGASDHGDAPDAEPASGPVEVAEDQTPAEIVERTTAAEAAPDPVCAVLRPPSLREAVKMSLLCAGSSWKLLDPARTEPQDYKLPHPVPLEGGPNEWVVALAEAYGLRFSR